MRKSMNCNYNCQRLTVDGYTANGHTAGDYTE